MMYLFCGLEVVGNWMNNSFLHRFWGGIISSSACIVHSQANSCHKASILKLCLIINCFIYCLCLNLQKYVVVRAMKVSEVLV